MELGSASSTAAFPRMQERHRLVGVVFGHETIAPASLLGTALVAAGAYLTSRAEAAGASSAETENSSIIATTTAVTSQEGAL